MTKPHFHLNDRFQPALPAKPSIDDFGIVQPLHSRLADKQSQAVDQRVTGLPHDPGDLLNATEIWFTLKSCRMNPVTRIKTTPITDGQPGSVVQEDDPGMER